MSEQNRQDAAQHEGYYLPDGWCWTTVDEITEQCQYGSSAKTSEDAVGLPVLRMGNIRDGRLDVTDLKYLPTDHEEFPKLLLREGDLLFNRTNSAELVGKSAVYTGVPFPCSYASYLVALRLGAACNPKYLCFYLNSHYGRLWVRSVVSQQVGQANVNSTKLRALCFPLAPLNEQRRIVAKMEELFSDLDAGVAALERARANLKRYRAAVLKAAVEGRLTADWRQQHPATEPASKLLDRILTERRRRWEAEQDAKFAAADKTPPKNWREKYVEPMPPTVTGLPELPESWCWASVQQVGFVQLGRQRSPQHHNGPHMHSYLRVANVFEDRIDISDVMEMNFTPQEFETFRLSFGDILLNEGQSMELIGRPAMYRDEVPGACFTNTLVRFRPLGGVDANFALKVFLAYLKNGRFQKIATITVNIAHLGAGRFSEIEFPLPPIDEQAAIIAEVERHFSLIEDAERFIVTSLARASRLRQSILKQAFEGKLVPQDPKNESASVLLERLRSSRSSHEANRKEQSPARTRGRRGKSVPSRREGTSDESR
jgi:type I restriction enzyme S subunit